MKVRELRAALADIDGEANVVMQVQYMVHYVDCDVVQSDYHEVAEVDYDQGDVFLMTEVDS